MKNSGYGKLNLHDLAKGGAVALFTSVIMSLLQILQSGHLPDRTQLVAALIAGMASLLGYLYKNLKTNSEDEMFTKEMAGSPTDAPTAAPNNPTPATSNPDKPRPDKP